MFTSTVVKVNIVLAQWDTYELMLFGVKITGYSKRVLSNLRRWEWLFYINNWKLETKYISFFTLTV